MSPEKTVLVVDDNPDFAESLALQLLQVGRTAVTSTSVQHALDVLDNDKAIGVVVTDIRMPDVDGLDFRRVLRHRFPDLPVILMTGMPVDRADLPVLIVTVLQKPFRIAALLDVLAGLK